MDLITYALCKKYVDKQVTNIKEDITPRIGENGNWFIGQQDTGVKAKVEESNIVADGIVTFDTENQEVFVIKEGASVIVGNATSSLTVEEINTLF